jgi:hypothetical protein
MTRYTVFCRSRDAPLPVGREGLGVGRFTISYFFDFLKK